MTSAGGVFDRATEDLAEGRLWKARDRLTSLVKAEPANQQALQLLGDVYMRMGDQPNAGRFWLLTEKSGPEVDSAIQAFEARWGNHLSEKLRMLPAREPLDAYPASVRTRLDGFAAEALEAGIEWPRAARKRWAVRPQESMSARDWMALALIAVLGPGVWLLGIAAAIYLVIGWLN